jgi:hypothetical protein
MAKKSKSASTAATETASAGKEPTGKQPAPAEAAAQAAPAAKPVPPKRPAFVPPPKPGGNFPGKDAHGKGGPKPPKGRIFRHQGR